jgi:hypothetical protein
MDDKDAARMLGLVRVAFGAVVLIAPRWGIRVWLGDRDPSPAARAATRGLGGRDIALGLGLLTALENDGPAARWLEAGAVADASDAVAALSGARRFPLVKLVPYFAVAAGATVLGLRLAEALDE